MLESKRRALRRALWRKVRERRREREGEGEGEGRREEEEGRLV